MTVPQKAESCCEAFDRYGSPSATGDADKDVIWMDLPAKDFSRAFLVGNGRLGALLHFDR